MANENNIVVAEHICKSYVGVQALDDVSITIKEGEIKCLAGENGCGKSTFVKIIAGVENATSGTIQINGKDLTKHTAKDAINEGIQVIFQDLSLFDAMSVADNIAMNKLIKEGKPLTNKKEIEKIAQEALGLIGVSLPLDVPVKELSIANRQIIAICRALALDAKLLFMDEPTTALTKNEVDSLLNIVLGLKQRNIAVVFISHKLDEVFEVSDRVTVLKDGKYVGCKNIEELNESTLVRMMVGRSVSYEALNQESYAAEKILEVKNISKEGNFKDISFTLHKGEILAFTGLVGAGRSETVKALFGLNPPDEGEIFIRGEKAELKKVSQAMKHKIAFIPEDRHQEGLILNMSMRDNITLSILTKLLDRLGFTNGRKIEDISKEYVNTLNIRPGQIDKMAKNFSGGNQQKIAVAKWLVTKPDILIIDEPTHGVDIASKTEIHKLLKSLAKEGMAIIMVSSEWQEVFALSDRVIVMRHGRIVHEDSTKDGDQNLMMEKAILGEGRA